MVFAVTLLLAGIYESFHTEAPRTVAAFHADRWIVPDGVTGPFTAATPISDAALDHVEATPGVKQAENVVIFRNVLQDGGNVKVVNVVGAPLGGLVRPPVSSGRAPRQNGEALADQHAGVKVGDIVRLGPMRLRIVGLTAGFAYFAGTPALLLTLSDGQRLAFGSNLSSAVITRGVPQRPIPGMRALDNSQVATDLARPTAAATTTIAVEAGMLALVAAGILGLMTYLSGLDRRVDFAVFKAVGVGNGRLLGGLVLESLALAVLSAVLAALVAEPLKSGFPIGVRLTGGVYAVLFGVALFVGLLVSAVSVRQAARIDPALAFGRN